MKCLQDKTVTDKIRFLQDTLYVINGKWKLPVIIALYYGNSRFRDLKSCIPGITSRVLSRELKALELNGLIHRIADKEEPARTLYRFAAYSETLIPVIRAMAQWGEQHRKTVMRQSPDPGRPAGADSISAG